MVEGMVLMKMNDLGRLRGRARATIGFGVLAACVVAILGLATTLYAQHRMPGQPVKEDRNHPWMNASLSPDERAAMVLKELTLDEKIDLLHGMGMPGWPREVQHPEPELGNGGAGFVLGVPRLGIPFIQMSDAAYGVRSSAENGRYSTAMPSNLGAAASWDPEAACAFGTVIGKDLRAQGYNMTLGGGVNITREPRNGRTFEYLGEDPDSGGNAGREFDEVRASTARDWRHQALRGERPGKRTE